MVKRTLVALLLLTACCTLEPVFAAIETTTVQGKVYLPGGGVATGGRIMATLSDAGSTPDGSGTMRVAGRKEGSISSEGVVTLTLVPNDAITPSGTYYTVRFSTTGAERASWIEKWSVTTSPDPVDIGSITRLETAPGLTVGDFMVYVSTEPSGACTAADVPTFAEDNNTLCECVSSVWSCGRDFSTENTAILQCVGGTNSGKRCERDADCPSSTCSTTAYAAGQVDLKQLEVTNHGAMLRPRGRAGERGIVVFTFDDAAGSGLVAADLLDTYNMNATFCVSIGKAGLNPGYCQDAGGGEGDGILSASDTQPEVRMTEAQIQQLIARGFEIGSHGYNEDGAASLSYETFKEDVEDHQEWMRDNAGYYASSYCVPAGDLDFQSSVWTSGWFNQVRSSTTGWQADEGLHYNPEGGMRFFGGSIFPDINTAATGQEVCDFIEGAVAYNPNAMLVLGFHCISDASEAYDASANTYPEDEFEVILKCAARLRDWGAVDVLSYQDAIAQRKAHNGPWNLLANWGFASITAAADDAAQWTIDNGATVEANTDKHPALRQVNFTSEAGNDRVFQQYVGGFDVGATYVAAVDVEWVNDQSGGSPHVNRRTWWEIEAWDGQGDSSNLIEGGIDKSDPEADIGYCIGDGTANHRDVCYFEFVAPTPTVRASIRAQGGSTSQNWIYRAPRLFKIESIGGKDPNSRTMTWPGLVTFSVAETFTSVSGGNKDVDIDVFGNTAPITQRGRGPAHFLITRVDVDVDAIDDYSWSIYGRPSGAGDIYCEKTNLIADDDDLTVCAYQDNASNDEFYSTGGDGDAGNQIHFRFTDASATEESVTVTIEGYVIR